MPRIKRGHFLKSPVDMGFIRTHPMINSAERDVRINRGEVNGVRKTPGWERIRVQFDSGAVDTGSPKEIAKAFEMRETIMSRRGIASAKGSGIENYGEKSVV